ncbi:EamA family transporter [uncultured Winogradskyella sp.]|uniref:EamA family transporter n=1 Tax=uncultured Winogradskyella sp. TaxID=395353 RepID=UPI003513812B
MIYLLLSILSSTAIFILFKSFDKYNVNTLNAIVFNYLTASICGFLFSQKQLSFDDIITSNWFPPAVALGALFIMMFYLMALTAQRNGLSVASVASKMSVIIPILFGVIVFKESLGFLKILGIVLALIAVYLTSSVSRESIRMKRAIMILPFLVFFGSGIVDTSINYFAPDDSIPLFSSTIFAIAAIIGLTLVVIKRVKEKRKIHPRAIPFGIALGAVNYGSIYFLLNALRVDGVETSSIFTINNVAIVALSTLCGLVFFKEIISTKNWLGISFAIISIIIVSLV